jgi:hypothetical protein
VVNALEGGVGGRPGEVFELCFRVWNRATVPLMRFVIARAIKSKSKRVGRTKTGAKKIVPGHPVIEAILREWWETGWREFMGRDPTADDLIVPNQLGERRNVSRANRDFKRGLKRLGLRERHQYVLRHSFITRTQITGLHGRGTPPCSGRGGRGRVDWLALCLLCFGGTERRGTEESGWHPRPST